METRQEIVYLAGSVNGHATFESANSWREKAQGELEAAGIKVLNPLRGRFFGADEPTEDIVLRDLNDIAFANILLVEMDFKDKAYIGTAMEIRDAYRMGKKIILWGGANPHSHWLKFHATRRFKTLDEAIKAIINREV